MRIIAGIAGGRKLKAPTGRDVRPTSDKVRGAIFNALRSKAEIAGAVVIDCFCGSGALGLEALSNGAASCLFIDNSRASLDLAKENAVDLRLDGAAFLFADVAKLKESTQQKPAAIVFLDPPYNKNLIEPALKALSAGGWLVAGGLCVVEAEKSFSVVPAGFEMLDEKNYGDTKVLFLRYSP